LAGFPIIRKFIAGLFLVIFALGVTPKITLHNLVADHQDGRIKSTLSDPFSPQLNKSSFNCQVDNLISESPFVAAETFEIEKTSIHFPALSAPLAEQVSAALHFSYGRRGPPVVE
jgi:hypothetical protein